MKFSETGQSCKTEVAKWSFTILFSGRAVLKELCWWSCCCSLLGLYCESCCCSLLGVYWWSCCCSLLGLYWWSYCCPLEGLYWWSCKGLPFCQSLPRSTLHANIAVGRDRSRSPRITRKASWPLTQRGALFLVNPRRVFAVRLIPQILSHMVTRISTHRTVNAALLSEVLVSMCFKGPSLTP